MTSRVAHETKSRRVKRNFSMDFTTHGTERLTTSCRLRRNILGSSFPLGFPFASYTTDGRTLTRFPHLQADRGLGTPVLHARGISQRGKANTWTQPCGRYSHTSNSAPISNRSLLRATLGVGIPALRSVEVAEIAFGCLEEQSPVFDEVEVIV